MTLNCPLERKTRIILPVLLPLPVYGESVGVRGGHPFEPAADTSPLLLPPLPPRRGVFDGGVGDDHGDKPGTLSLTPPLTPPRKGEGNKAGENWFLLEGV